MTTVPTADLSFAAKVQRAWDLHQSLLCVGFDPVVNRLPASFAKKKQKLFEFTCAIAQTTARHACAFKPQIAHYASLGAEDQLVNTIRWLKEHYPDHLVILDAKRGDIDSTAEFYAREAFDRYGADALTVNPYLGGDALAPFMQRPDRGCFVLCRTSNPGSGDFQGQGDPPLYLQVARMAETQWNNQRNLGLVAAATWPEQLGKIRRAAPSLPLLVPGIGAQQGDLMAVLSQGLNAAGSGLIINSSRAILYASDKSDFAEAAGTMAASLCAKINAARPDILAHRAQQENLP